jgi:IS5 family transposase
VIVNRKTRQVICVAQDKGSVHDFNLYKKTIGAAIDTDIRVQADSGYQGIESLHKNSETTKKKSKKHPLTKEEKEANRKISRERIVIENVNSERKFHPPTDRA